MHKQMVLYIAVGFFVIVVFLVIFIIWWKLKSRKVITVHSGVDEEKEDNSEYSKDNYESITQKIIQAKKYKSILFTSAEIGALPVTIPVKTVMELAKKKQRCLLIDLDLRRDAVAKVFGLEPESNWAFKSIQTEFENLCIWPAHKFSQSKQMNIKKIVEKALDKSSPDKFDFILINAPALISNLDRRQIMSAAHAAFVCTKDTSERTKLDQLIESSNCRIIGHIQMS